MKVGYARGSTKDQLLLRTMRLPHGPGREARGDYEYERAGVASMFMLFAPLGGWREFDVRDRRTAIDFAHDLHDLSDVHFPEADKITLVPDNLDTHQSSLIVQGVFTCRGQPHRGTIRVALHPNNMSPGSISPNTKPAFFADNASPGASLTRQLWPPRSRRGKQHETTSAQDATGNSRPRTREPSSRNFTHKKTGSNN